MKSNINNLDLTVLIILLAIMVGLMAGYSISNQAHYTHKAIDTHCTNGHYLVTHKATYYCEMMSDE